MMLLTTVLVALLCLVSCAAGGMSCIGIRNKEQGDCSAKHEHLCNMQSGLWTKSYIISPENGSYNGE